MPKSSKRNIKLANTATGTVPVLASLPATAISSKPQSVPAANVAASKPATAVPVKASPVASVPNPDASAIRLAKAFCNKASKPSRGRTPNGESVRDTSYLAMLCIAAKRHKTTSPRVLDVAKIYLATPGLIAANSHPALDLDVLNNRLIHHGYITRATMLDDIEKAAFTLTDKAKTSGAYARAN